MRTGFYPRCDLIKMPLHGGGIALGHDHGRAGATGGTDGAEYEGRLSALILGHRWPGYLVLLTNPSLVPPPDLCRRANLKAWPGSAPACRGSIFLKAFEACRQFDRAHRLQRPAHCRRGYREAQFKAVPTHQTRRVPVQTPVHRRERTVLKVFGLVLRGRPPLSPPIPAHCRQSVPPAPRH